MQYINDITTYVIYDIVPDIIYIVLFCMQDCVCLVAPYPYRSEPFDEFIVTRDFDITGAGDVWYARPQLFFKCQLVQQTILASTRSFH